MMVSIFPRKAQAWTQFHLCAFLFTKMNHFRIWKDLGSDQVSLGIRKFLSSLHLMPPLQTDWRQRVAPGGEERQLQGRSCEGQTGNIVIYRDISC